MIRDSRPTVRPIDLIGSDGAMEPVELEAGNVNRWSVGLLTDRVTAAWLPQSLENLRRSGWDEPHLFAERDTVIPDECENVSVTRRVAGVPPTVAWSLALEELVFRDPQADAYLLLFDRLMLSGELREFLEACLWPAKQLGALALSGVTNHLPKEVVGFYEESKDSSVKTVWGAAAHVIPGPVASALSNAALQESVNTLVRMESVDRFVGRLCRDIQFSYFRHTPQLASVASRPDPIQTVRQNNDGKQSVEDETLSPSVTDLLFTTTRSHCSKSKELKPMPWFHEPLRVERLTLGMIVLNEEEYLEANLRQHYDWADEILIVEGADRHFPSQHVTPEGLSRDRTVQIVYDFPDPDKKIQLIRYGWAVDKSELRNQYTRFCREGLLLVVDADEFWLQADQTELLRLATRSDFQCYGFSFRHFWKDADSVVSGSMFDVPHWRLYRFEPGSYYGDNHNYLRRSNGRELHRLSSKLLDASFGIYCYHFGHAKRFSDMRAKTDYYRARGECRSRPENISCREAWFEETLPPEVRLHPYDGPLPEALTDRSIPR